MKKSELRQLIREEIQKIYETKPNSSAKKFFKGMKKIKVDELGKWMPGVDYVYYDKDSKKWWFADFEGNAKELRNKYTLEQLNKFIKKQNIKL